MFGTNCFEITLREAIRRRVKAAPKISAAIRKTASGVRVRFSNGRLTWLDRDPSTSEADFLTAVSQWARRHGAETVDVEPDYENSPDEKSGSR